MGQLTVRAGELTLAQRGQHVQTCSRHAERVKKQRHLIQSENLRIILILLSHRKWITSFHSSYFLRFTIVDHRTWCRNKALETGAATEESDLRWVNCRLSANGNLLADFNERTMININRATSDEMIKLSFNVMVLRS